MDNKSDGWKEEYTSWWFDFLNEKGGKGVSKDTWVMVRVRIFLSVVIQLASFYDAPCNLTLLLHFPSSSTSSARLIPNLPSMTQKVRSLLTLLVILTGISTMLL
jgi:hypothetical protein